MTSVPVPARLATVVAEYRTDTARWGQRCPDGGGEHHARRESEQQPPGELGQPDSVAQGWDGRCTGCGAPIPWDDGEVYGSSGNVPVYDTPSGRLEPGCLFWTDHAGIHSCFARWTNCDGRHLHAVLPTGQQWDIDSRARNCGSPDDTEHRCWIRHGEPPAVHVDKAGRTCSAGAGSIAVPGYHGFLHAGTFTAG